MKFEEVLPALREGKQVRRKNGYYTYYLNKYSEDNYSFRDTVYNADRDIEANDIIADDWEIIEEPKTKVKYYPILIKQPSDNKVLISNSKFKDLEEAKLNAMGVEIIRIVTEIPELIEERDDF